MATHCSGMGRGLVHDILFSRQMVADPKDCRTKYSFLKEIWLSPMYPLWAHQTDHPRRCFKVDPMVAMAPNMW